MDFCLIFSLLLFILEEISAYPEGAPPSACDSMTPEHGASPQTGPVPFSISVPSSYTPEVAFTVAITSNAGASYKGLLLQARNSTTKQNNALIFGNVYAISTHGYKGMDCTTTNVESQNGLPNTITHANNTNKSPVASFDWTIHQYVGPIVFVATFVTSKTTFWTYVTSDQIQQEPCHGKICADGKTCVSSWEACPETPCPLKDQYRCLSTRACGDYRCDGIVQCSGGDDEECCDDTFYQCAADRLCISRKYVCDDHMDCVDGTDESNCEVETTTAFTEVDSSTSLAIIIGVACAATAVVIVMFIVGCCVFLHRRKKFKQNSQPTQQPVVTGALPPSATPRTYQTSSLHPGVYPYPGTGTATPGFVNQGFVSPQQQQQQAAVNMVPRQYGGNSNGINNLSHTGELPPSYDQAMYDANQYEQIEDGNDETLQNKKNALYEESAGAASTSSPGGSREQATSSSTSKDQQNAYGASKFDARVPHYPTPHQTGVDNAAFVHSPTQKLSPYSQADSFKKSPARETTI